jgi:uncharacterized protein
MSSKGLSFNEMEELLFQIDGDSFSIFELHGYLTAIIIGPKVVLPSVWLPYIFNKQGDMPEYESIEEANRIIKEIMNFYNWIINELDTEKYFPIFSVKEVRKREVLDPIPWCVGFAKGVSLDGDAWFSEKDESLMALIIPIYYFVDPADFKELTLNASGRKKRGLDKTMLSMIPRAVFAIRDYWRKKMVEQKEKPKGHVLPFKPKRKKSVSRNDPCPCGSGKKYKYCCGKNR